MISELKRPELITSKKLKQLVRSTEKQVQLLEEEDRTASEKAHAIANEDNQSEFRRLLEQSEAVRKSAFQVLADFENRRNESAANCKRIWEELTTARNQLAELKRLLTERLQYE